jgi:UDPglucose 6-dehydrogenase
VIGTVSERAQKILREVYRPLYLNETPIVFTQPETAEIIKYAANAFLATKITFINEIANLCEKANGDVQTVARALGLDGRIGGKFLHAGPGYGGSCFPKDTLALVQTGEKMGAPQNIVGTVVQVNEQRKREMAEKIIAAAGGDVNGVRIGILGISFKPETDDVRDAPSLTIVPLLQEAGASVAAYDPAARQEAQKHLSGIDWKDNPYAVSEQADVLVILTEWNEFRSLDLGRIAGAMRRRCLVDLRNIYKPEEMAGHGFHYVSVGRPPVTAGEETPALREAAGGR